ncbi:MAG: class I SAM-dependent methyltransferase [Campylobacterales bacterium]|nr:class I SAM-dependent methyltransferase [Campylobacterales bacterium]
MEITEKSFWEKYWGTIILPSKINFSFKNDRVIAQTILDYIPVATENQIALEIGCAPGKWMLFLYEKLNYIVHGFEYLDVAAEKTRENLLICAVPDEKFDVITADFLTQVPIKKYDLVLSLGFIEHFDNYQDIFNRHLSYGKKGGYIVIGFPNFRGLNYYIQSFIDKISGTKIIKNHNIVMMDKKIMEDMLNNLNKKIIFIDYIGGFESALFNTNDIKNPLIRLFTKIIIKLISFIFPSTANKYISSYLMFVIKND